MAYLFLNDIIYLAILVTFLIVVYRRIIHNWNFIERIRQRYSEFDKKIRVQDRIRLIRRQPADRQKLIFKDASALSITLLIIFLIATRSIFFADVISQSMVPTFDKNDLVLMQNIDRNYNVGDIVMFESIDLAQPVSHRIVAVDESGIRTAGDATKRTDWWTLKNGDIEGKAITFQGVPIIIKGVGKYFTIEDRNQRFGPFDYQSYGLFLRVIKAYGYAIVVFSLLAYIVLTLKRNDKEKYMFTNDNIRK